ncbi:MAG TPA: hypothetical protein PKK48_09650, partial [Phycisphaerae bacterium]|nr:hypothetical protein [Phycisphaerae bacterium]
RYHRWVKPIIALFDILGTVPGYKEYDMAPFFMLAMPVFTAMLVGDAGYGLIFTLVGLIFGRKLHRLTGNKSAGQLITIFGIFTIIWGVITANYFGVGPSDIAKAGGYGCIVKGEFQPDYHAMEIADGGWADFGKIMLAPAVLWRPNDSDARDIVMKISFIIAVLHLMLAHMRKMVGLFPSQQFIAEAGWMIFIFGMFELVWLMFFGAPPVGSTTLMIYFLAVGMLLFSLFSFPSPNPVKRVGFGIMTNLLPIISSFGDTLSYIRLMAVGLASYYMASAFNGLAMKIFHADWYLAWTGVLILLAAHALNIFLCVIAIFAHGVRLNLLEFSNNCGVEWAGYPYTPFYDTLEKQGE